MIIFIYRVMNYNRGCNITPEISIYSMLKIFNIIGFHVTQNKNVSFFLLVFNVSRTTWTVYTIFRFALTTAKMLVKFVDVIGIKKNQHYNIFLPVKMILTVSLLINRQWHSYQNYDKSSSLFIAILFLLMVSAIWLIDICFSLTGCN